MKVPSDIEFNTEKAIQSDKWTLNMLLIKGYGILYGSMITMEELSML